jgi:phenylpropionate dioxygenase-like ring-hydroxylating dioxygenase large terminal subunit
MEPNNPMIDPQRGTVSREIFVSPETYREELEKLFARAWLFVGHEPDPKPGTSTSRAWVRSGDPCRDQAGAGTPLNSCCTRDEGVPLRAGNTSLFVCLYHSWSYTTDGRLQACRVPRAV